MAESNATICVQSADEYLLASVREVLGQGNFNFESERCKKATGLWKEVSGTSNDH